MIAFYLLVVIVLSYIAQLAFPWYTNLLIFAPQLALSEPWRFVTSIFLHSTKDILHIFFNCYALFLFGTILESKVTKKDFLTIFFMGGIIGSILYYLTIMIGIIPPIPALGASGAIYAVLGATAVMLPEMRIYMWFFPVKMKYAVIFWILMETFGTFSVASGIASAAHLGGLAFGLIYTKYFIKKEVPVDPYYWAVKEN
ncbi:MAG: rhomboid family intramembrane serine protease [Candidatus Micrarchaeota archaeon]|nr:rhomboid family intramembrane serine protease [Candidatus Micrarchaeota archaeon]